MRAVAAQVQVIDDVAGTVAVRAKPPGGRLNDAKPLCGFFGYRRRYEGDVFRIRTWQEFSPRWMEFVDKCPDDWKPHIEQREAALADFIEVAKRENVKTAQERQLTDVFSMFQLQQRQGTNALVAEQLEKLQKQNAELLAALDNATKPSLKGKA